MRKPLKKPWLARASSVVFALIGVAAIAFVIGHGFSAQSSDTAQVRALTLQVKASALRVKRATAEIQHERFRNIRDGCRKQNDSHAKAVAALNEFAAKAKAEDPRKSTRIDRSVVILRAVFIDTLAESHKDCAKYAQSQVAGS